MLQAVDEDLGGGNVCGNGNIVHVTDAQQVHLVRLAGLGADGVAEEEQHVHFLTGDARHDLLGTAVAAGELALLLWEAAGTPAPAALLPADAAPVQQALAWAIENQLLAPDVSAEDSVSRWEVIRSWGKINA